MSEHKCPCCGAPIDGKTAAQVHLITEVVKFWNTWACQRGFAKVNKLTAARVRTLKAAIKDYPHLPEWVRAIKNYCDDAKRWPERTRYGFDTFIRPSQRDRWFDAPEASDGPSDEDYLRQYR